MQKLISPLERTGKFDNKMLWFERTRLKVLEILMKSSRDMKDQKLVKYGKNAESAK